jgi:hypothetical protein
MFFARHILDFLISKFAQPLSQKHYCTNANQSGLYRYLNLLLSNRGSFYVCQVLDYYYLHCKFAGPLYHCTNANVTGLKNCSFLFFTQELDYCTLRRVSVSLRGR